MGFDPAFKGLTFSVIRVQIHRFFPEPFTKGEIIYVRQKCQLYRLCQNV